MSRSFAMDTNEPSKLHNGKSIAPIASKRESFCRQVNYTRATVAGVDGGSLHSFIAIVGAVVLSHNISRAATILPLMKAVIVLWLRRACVE
jgi:hypothetical protein